MTDLLVACVIENINYAGNQNAMHSELNEKNVFSKWKLKKKQNIEKYILRGKESNLSYMFLQIFF